MKIRNIGIVNQAGDNLTNGTRADISYLRAELKDKGNFYLKCVQDYLLFYHTLYPVYMKEKKDKLRPNFTSPTPSCDVAFDKGPNSREDLDARYYTKWQRS